MPLVISTRPAHDGDAAAISRLHATTLGPGRFARTAYRVREGTRDVSTFCRVAVLGERLIAALRMTDICIGHQPGALMLGPLAVDPEFMGQGFGRKLIAESIELARTEGVKLIILVGDLPYYGRFGFAPVPAGQIQLPGPVNLSRLLALELVPGALARYRGHVAARR
jgi:predicted N-acetyltransferase YhbS